MHPFIGMHAFISLNFFQVPNIVQLLGKTQEKFYFHCDSVGLRVVPWALPETLFLFTFAPDDYALAMVMVPSLSTALLLSKPLPLHFLRKDFEQLSDVVALCLVDSTTTLRTESRQVGSPLHPCFQIQEP